MYHALLTIASLVGLGTWRVLWVVGMPERYVAPRVAGWVEVPLTLDSDNRGLYL